MGASVFGTAWPRISGAAYFAVLFCGARQVRFFKLSDDLPPVVPALYTVMCSKRSTFNVAMHHNATSNMFHECIDTTARA